MKIFVEPMGLHSRAMVRIANALKRYASPNVQFVKRVKDADVVVLYVIAADALNFAHECFRRGQEYIVVQCCMKTAGGDMNLWQDFWRHARMVWSYYNLPAPNFYHSPLGIDDAFRNRQPLKKIYDVVTTGYVSGPGAEAIHEVWEAVDRLGMRGFHIGPPRVSGAAPSSNWSHGENLDDETVAHIYSQSRYVAAMRYVEGFELPAAEGLMCGARPIMFPQESVFRWFANWAIFAHEQPGAYLVGKLMSILRSDPFPLDEGYREDVGRLFNWQSIVDGFYTHLQVGRQEQEARA